MNNSETIKAEIQETPEPNVVSVPSYSNSNKWVKIGLLGVVGLLVAGSLVFAGFKLGQKEEQAKPPLPPPTSILTTPPTPTPTPVVEDETAGWKIYTDTEQRLSFRYPQEWYVDASDGRYYQVQIHNYKPLEFGGGGFEKGQYLLTVTKWTDNIENKQSQQTVVSVDDLKVALTRKDNEIASHYKEAVVNKVNVRNQREIVVNGFKGLYREVSYPEAPDFTNEETYLLDGRGTVLQIIFVLDVDSGSLIYNQILSTFRFLE